MGRPYEHEIAELPLTYEWARTVDLSPLAQALAYARGLPLLAVGSGGSYSLATIAAYLHERVTARPARALTPLELGATPVNLRGMAVLLLTARGTNTDILNAFAETLVREPAEFIVLTLRDASPLFLRASAFESVRLPRFAPPVGKDGYLATNSLLAMAVLLTRAYMPSGAELPATFDELRPTSEDLPDETWRRPTIIALHGSATHAAAIDLESKFAEAALANVHVVDFRNFAHGRHLWLARRPSETLIISFSTPADRAVADGVLRLVPRTVPRLRIDVEGEPEIAALRGLTAPLLLAARAGRAHGVDVGRPSVPRFGRQMYHLRRGRKRIPTAYCFIERKTRQRWETLDREETLDGWLEALTTFQESLERTWFSGIVLDYDGTLCTAAERFTGCREDIVHELQRLLHQGLIVGIATGRGKSVRKDLQQKLSRDVWGHVLVGYYNGGDIAALSDVDRPLTGPPSAGLEIVLQELQQSNAVKNATITARPRQITVEVSGDSSLLSAWDAVAHIVLTRPETGITVVRSTHSIDLLDRGVSKRAVIAAIQERAGDRSAKVLAIGDQGRWPGNDSVLLQEPLSLSVDETSADERTCWNLAPVGYRQAQAAVYYLRSMEVTNGRVRVKLRKKERGR